MGAHPWGAVRIERQRRGGKRQTRSEKRRDKRRERQRGRGGKRRLRGEAGVGRLLTMDATANADDEEDVVRHEDAEGPREGRVAPAEAGARDGDGKEEQRGDGHVLIVEQQLRKRLMHHAARLPAARRGGGAERVVDRRRRNRRSALAREGRGRPLEQLGRTHARVADVVHAVRRRAAAPDAVRVAQLLAIGQPVAVAVQSAQILRPRVPGGRKVVTKAAARKAAEDVGRMACGVWRRVTHCVPPVGRPAGYSGHVAPIRN